MAKVVGAYESLSRGVSQQPQSARLPGQHGEQINLWSDPVYGLSRRRGTLFQGRRTDTFVGNKRTDLTDAQWDEAQQYFAAFRSFPWTVAGDDLVVHYATKAVPSFFVGSGQTWPFPVFVTRKRDVHPTLGNSVEDAAVDFANADSATNTARAQLGFSAGCQVGDYALLYPNNTLFPNASYTDEWASSTNNVASCQILQGVPSRQYRLTVEVSGASPIITTYTTPSTAYGGSLDTSDIPYSDPEYTKKVNDRVNAYNSAVTSWITTAASLTTPRYIAGILTSSIVGPGITVYIDDTTGAFVLKGADLLRVQLDDGETGENTKCAYKTVQDVSDLPAMAHIGQVIQIKPKDGAPAYYLRSKTQLDVPAFSPAACIWEETSRYKSPFESPFPGLLLVRDSSGDVHMYSSPSSVRTALPGTEIPDWGVQKVGDEITNPTPAIFGKQITYMTTFQDRLLLAAGNVVNMSETSNYFNFWRTTTLTVPDSDPVEIYAMGSENDRIQHGVIFDKNLLLFGDKQQYAIDGKNPVTPATISIIQAGAIEDAVDAAPALGAGLVFFARAREGSTEVFQMTPGAYEGSTDYTGLGVQIRNYIPGKPRQLLFVPSPSTLFVRTDADPYGVYVFRFLDQGQQRLLDSWSRLEYSPNFGQIISMFWHNEYLCYLVLRDILPDNGVMHLGKAGDWKFVLYEAQSLLADAGTLPCLDSMRLFDSNQSDSSSDAWDNPLWDLAVAKTNLVHYLPSGLESAVPNPDNVAFETPYWLHGVSPAPAYDEPLKAAMADLPGLRSNDDLYNPAKHQWPFCYIGLPYRAEVELTSPLRQNDAGSMPGRLTVNRLDVSYHQTGSFSADITSRFGLAQQYTNFSWQANTTPYGTVTSLKFNGQQLDANTSMVGIVPVVDGTAPVFVGRESSEYVCKIKAVQWLPMTIQRITWAGQWFQNSRQV